MEIINNTKPNTDILLKYADFIASYEDFLVGSKNRMVGFWSDIKIWLIGKALYHAFLLFTKDKLNEEISITPMNYNSYSQRKNKFRELVNQQKINYEPISSQNLSWALRSLLISFSNVFEKIEIYTTRLEVALEEVNKQLEQDIVFMKDVKEFDFDNYVKPPQNWDVIGSIESDESIEELLKLLTK